MSLRVSQPLRSTSSQAWPNAVRSYLSSAARPFTASASSASAALPAGTGRTEGTAFIHAVSSTGASLGPVTDGSATANWPAVKNQHAPETSPTDSTISTAHAWRERRRARRYAAQLMVTVALPGENSYPPDEPRAGHRQRGRYPQCGGGVTAPSTLV
ncbi:hypothetical protein D9M72_508480 [compost metagenome]